MDQMSLFEVLLHTGPAPTKAYHNDAGFDLVVAEDFDVAPHAVGKIPLATTCKSPEGYWGLILGRSSTFARGLLVNPGVIDEGYTGPLFAVCHNMTADWVPVKAGERVVQWIPFETIGLRLQQVDGLPNTERGSNGFGSSGL